MTISRKRRNAYVGAGAALILVIGGAVATYVGGPGDAVGTSPVAPPPVEDITLELIAPRDVGRLCSAVEWCALVRTPEHCGPLNETSGDATDLGTPGGWVLSPVGNPRQGVIASVPVADSTGWVDTTTERAVFFDHDGVAANGLRLTPGDNLSADATQLVSVTTVSLVRSEVLGPMIFSFGDSGERYQMQRLNNGRMRWIANGTTTTKTITETVSTASVGVWNCHTIVFDARTASAAKMYLNGVDITPAAHDFSGIGSMRKVGGQIVIGTGVGPTGGNTLNGAVLRYRTDEVVITQAQHQTFCGSFRDFKLGSETTKVVDADHTYTQTGGTRCTAQSPTVALCHAGGDPAHVVRPSMGLAWVQEPDRTNRILDSFDLSTGNWGGDATTLAVPAPDGSLTAYDTFVDDASSISSAPTGYTASADVFPRLWVKCAAGSLLMGTNGAAAGSWTIDCTTVAGVWAELYDGHAAVTEATQFATSSTGDATIIFSADATGVSFQAWMPTLTLARGLSVIRTEGAAVSTGTITRLIDNDPPVYYAGGAGKITIRADYISGACVDVTGGTQVGRSYGDATDWFAFDSSSATAFIANLVLSGVDEAIIRWDSVTSLGGTDFAQVLLNGVQATWDATPSSGWTAASPTQILLDGHGSTSCTAALQTIRIEGSP